MKNYVIFRIINGVVGYVTATKYLLYRKLDFTHVRKFTKDEVDEFMSKNKNIDWDFKKIENES